MTIIIRLATCLVGSFSVACSSSDDNVKPLLGTWYANGSMTVDDPRNNGDRLTEQQKLQMREYFSTTVLSFKSTRALKTNRGIDPSEHQWVAWKLLESADTQYRIEIVENKTPVQLTLLKLDKCIGLVSEQPYFVEHFCREEET